MIYLDAFCMITKDILDLPFSPARCICNVHYCVICMIYMYFTPNVVISPAAYVCIQWKENRLCNTQGYQVVNKNCTRRTRLNQNPSRRDVQKLRLRGPRTFYAHKNFLGLSCTLKHFFTAEVLIKSVHVRRISK